MHEWGPGQPSCGRIALAVGETLKNVNILRNEVAQALWLVSFLSMTSVDGAESREPDVYKCWAL